MLSSRANPPLAWAWLLMALVALSSAQSQNETLKRMTRQAAPTPFFPGPAGVLNVPLLTSVNHYLGADQFIDQCTRAEVQLPDGSCNAILTQGSCQLTEVVLLDPYTNKGYCAPRLCPPDRVFVYSTQLCHDPREMGVCPPGRELYVSSYGTPVCSCPDGTYEEDDDLDDDVCEPLLSQILNCPMGQVFWFADFSMPPQCVPDPCYGLNLKRGPNDLPYVPRNPDGKCFQLGQSSGVCPAMTWYALAMDKLRGFCSSLDEAGYNVYSEKDLAALKLIYGDTIIDNNAPVVSSSQAAVPHQANAVEQPGANHLAVPSAGPSLHGQGGQASGRGPSATISFAGPSVDISRNRLRPFIPIRRDSRVASILKHELAPHSRKKRTLLPHATPMNVFESRLLACKAGAKRDINAKCRKTVLPSFVPKRRPSRASGPIRPTPSCPQGQVYNLQRRCVSRSGAQSSFNAFAFG